MDSRIKVEGIEQTVAILRKTEPELLAKLRKEIKNEPGLQSAMAGIKSNIPPVSPLRGMINNGPKSYKGATVKPLVVTSTSRVASRGQTRLVTISTAPPASGVGFEIIDMVGRGARGNSPKAEGMKKKLGGSPSRYVWKGFESKQQGVSSAVLNIVEKYAAIVNVKLR